jgi:hypothetical protein
MKLRWRVWVPVFFAVLSCGGTAAKIAYVNLDALILYEVRDWFSLTGEQESQFVPRLNELIRWHRYEVLPQYKPLLRSAQEKILSGIGEKEYLGLSSAMSAEVRRIAERVSPYAADLALSLSDAQLEHFSLKCSEFNAKAQKRIREKSRNPDAYRVGQMLKTLERFYGPFDSGQKKRIAAIVLSYDDAENPELYLRYVRETQNGFVHLLRTKRDRAAVRAYLRGWICRDPGFVPSYYRAELERSAALNAGITAEIDRTIVRPQQRKTGAEGLQGYADAIDELIQR